MSLQIVCAIHVLRKNKNLLSHTHRSVLISELSEYMLYYCKKCGHCQKYKDRTCNVCNHNICQKCDDIKYLRTYKDCIYRGTYAICNPCFSDVNNICQYCQEQYNNPNGTHGHYRKRCSNCKIGPLCKHNMRHRDFNVCRKCE